MKTHLTLIALGIAAAAVNTRAATNPVVACATTTFYANVTDPIKLAFAPDGTLYVGRDNVGSGGNPGDAVKIHRVAPGGSPVTEFGDTAIADPDAVAVDVLGLVSGTPGAVLVGGAVSGGGARISKINPSGVVTTLFGGLLTNMNNPGELIFDAAGRLYISDTGSNQVFATSSTAAPTNLLSQVTAYTLALDVSNRLAVGSFTVPGHILYSTNGAPLVAYASIRKAGAPLVAGPGDTFWGRELYSVSVNDELIRIDSFGNAVVVGTGFDGSLQMAFGPDNALYVGYRDYDVILRIAPVATPVPDHWWPADGNASNAVSTAHGTASGSVTYAPGRFGQAFSFDGTFSSQVTFGTNAGNFGTGDFTIGLWIKTATSNALNIQFLEKRASCSHQNFWALSMAGRPYIELDQDTSGINYFSVGANLPVPAQVADAQWHHVAFVRRGGAGYFYRDAVLVGSKATNFVTQLSNAALLTANSGICAPFGAEPLNGLLDEIKLYGCALSAAQVAQSAGLADCFPLPSGLVAWWGAEGNANDFAGNHHGSLSNGAAFATALVGRAFSFDGINDFVDVADSASLRPATNLTIEGWIKTPGVVPSALAGFIVAKSGNSGVSGYELAVGTPAQSGRLRFTMNGGASGADMFGSNSVSDNLFHHVAATCDGAKMRVYRDGVCEAEQNLSQTISYSVGDPLTIGRREYALVPGYFIGLIDELSIYDQALSASEIAAIFAAGSAGKCDSPTLNIVSLAGAVRLSWTSNATGFLLETNGTLTLPAGWGVLTSNYNVLSTDYVVTNAIGGATRFYRLHKP